MPVLRIPKNVVTHPTLLNPVEYFLALTKLKEFQPAPGLPLPVEQSPSVSGRLSVPQSLNALICNAAWRSNSTAWWGHCHIHCLL